jgi:hypothetical protein
MSAAVAGTSPRQGTPPHRLSFAERTRIQKEFELLQQKREDKLHSHEQEMKQKFLAELEAQRLAEQKKQQEFQERIAKEKAERQRREAEEREAKRQQQQKQAQLDSKR